MINRKERSKELESCIKELKKLEFLNKDLLKEISLKYSFNPEFIGRVLGFRTLDDEEDKFVVYKGKRYLKETFIKKYS